MKQIFLTIAKHGAITAALVVLVAAPFAPLVAQADIPVAGDTTDTRNIPAADNPNSGFGNLNPNLAPATPSPTGGGSSSDSGCSVLSGSGFALCITNIVYVFTVGIGSGFAYVSAYFFDWAIALSLNGSAYALDFVSQGWTTARDMANMAFLFILLYIAFKIIFEAETNETVHMLTWVIIIALLVNFSFFFTRLVIDAGNILSIQFYNAIDAPSVGSTAAGSGVQSTVASVAGVTGSSFNNSKDLTAGIMGMLNLQGLFGAESFKTFKSGQTGASGFLVTLIATSFLYIAAGIMLWLLTVALITNGVKFLVRIVVLWFLIIASPLAFVARAVPKFEKHYHEWQNSLINHAFYPVAFMFIFLILTNFAKQMGGQNNLINGIFNNIPGSSSGASVVSSLGMAVANVGIRMGFVIAMLYIGMEASKKIGVMGADAANHAGNWVGSKMIGTYGAAGRNTLGWAGSRLGQSGIMQNWAAKDSLIGRTLWRGANRMGGASFDVRSAPGLKSMLPKDLVGETTGKGGYRAAFDARVKQRQDEAKLLKETTKEDMDNAEKEGKRRAEAEHDKNNPGERTNIATDMKAAATEQKSAADALKGAVQNIEDLVKQGKQGSPEMDAAISNRKGRESEHANATKRLAELEGKSAKIEETIKARTKALTPEVNLRNIYAKSIENDAEIRDIFRLGISRYSDRVAASKIRKGKSAADRVLEAIKEDSEKGGGEEKTEKK